MKEQRSDANKLDVLLSLANQTPAVGQFLLRLGELRGRLEGQEPGPACPFVLSTIHASKGLEYDRVILIDAVDGVLPSGTESGGPPEGEDLQTLEEERRLFYVGATRARKQLDFLCYEKKFGEAFSGTWTFVSQFMGGEPPRESAPGAQGPARSRPAGPGKEQLAAWEEAYIPGTDVTL